MSTAAIALNHYLNETPSQMASNLNWKKNFWSTVEKTCWVALIAIPVAILTLAYSSVVLTEALSCLMMGFSLLSTGAVAVIANFREWADDYGSLSRIEMDVDSEYVAIQDWKTPEIERFYEEQGLDAHRIAIEAMQGLQQKESQEPLRALLPLIARFEYLKKRAEKIERTVNEMFHHGLQNQSDRFLNWEIAWHKLEAEAIPTALEAAVVLHILQNPIRELTLKDLGELNILSYANRRLSREFGHNDDYVVFKDLHRRPLTLGKIKQDLDPRKLHAKLFPVRV